MSQLSQELKEQCCEKEDTCETNGDDSDELPPSNSPTSTSTSKNSPTSTSKDLRVSRTSNSSASQPSQSPARWPHLLRF